MQRPAASRAPWRRGRLTYRVLSFGGSLLRLQDHRVGLSQRLPTSGQRTKQASNGIALLAEPCLDLSICVQSVGFSRAPLWSVLGSEGDQLGQGHALSGGAQYLLGPLAFPLSPIVHLGLKTFLPESNMLGVRPSVLLCIKSRPCCGGGIVKGILQCWGWAGTGRWAGERRQGPPQVGIRGSEMTSPSRRCPSVTEAWSSAPFRCSFP